MPVLMAGLLTTAVTAAVVVAGTIVLHVRTATPPSTSGKGTRHVVPWLDEPVPNVARPFTKAGVAPCVMSNLAVSVRVPDSSYIGAGPVNTSFWDVRVRDRGTMPCYVSQGFAVTFRTAQGTVAIKRSPLQAVDITYLWPQGQRPPAGYASEADGEIGTGPCALPPITAMVLSAGPGLGSVVVSPGPAGGSGTPCLHPESYYSELFDAAASPIIPLTGTSLRAPATMHPGERVRFLVTITDSMGPRHCIAFVRVPGCGAPNPRINFQRCPSFHVELEGIEGSFHTFLLDCPDTRPLASGQSEVFEMYIDVPANAHPGPAVLTWSIDGEPMLFGAARAAVWVNAA